MVMIFFTRYVDQFSRSLYVEYKSKGIDVQCQVITNLNRCMTSDFHMIASFFYNLSTYFFYPPFVVSHASIYILVYLAYFLPNKILPPPY